MNKGMFAAVAQEIINSMKDDEERTHLSMHCHMVEANLVETNPCWLEVLATIVVASKIIVEGGPQFKKPRRKPKAKKPGPTDPSLH